jgi:hypothetical protein
MNRDITAESVCDMMIEALAHVHRDDLAYLFATGKNELYLRDHLAAYMHRNLGLREEQFVGREWKKHDLTINNGAHPYAIIEESPTSTTTLQTPCILRVERTPLSTILSEILARRPAL